jgi:uncharacterized protein
VTLAAQAFFLDFGLNDGGQRFAIHHAPAAQPARGNIVYVHPLAEEMNRSRRMAAMMSRALAAAGYSVLQIDLLGCGDSASDFGEASWTAWVNDVVKAAAWLTERHRVPLWLWGLRAGALVASEACQRLPGGTNLLLWQPQASGKLALQQFLRLAAAAGILEGSAKSATSQAKQALATGQSVSIAGYTLGPALANGLERAILKPASGRTLWLEVTTQPDLALLPASTTLVKGWQDQGASIDTDVVPGPAFWQTTEIEDAPALLTATLALLGKE